MTRLEKELEKQRQRLLDNCCPGENLDGCPCLGDKGCLYPDQLEDPAHDGYKKCATCWNAPYEEVSHDP